VRVPGWLIERGNARENQTIEGLAEGGMSPGQIARELGLTREVVKRKLRKKKQRAAGPV
jgi:DNA-binding CsgD family transcriptional regulator